MSDPTALAARTQELAQAVGDMSEQLTELTEELAAEQAQGKRYRMIVLGLLMSMVVSFAGLGLTAYAISEQNRLISFVLCPLYSLFVGSYNPNSRQAGEDRAAYENAFVTIRAGYAELGCTSPVVPPPQR